MDLKQIPTHRAFKMWKKAVAGSYGQLFVHVYMCIILYTGYDV